MTTSNSGEWLTTIVPNHKNSYVINFREDGGIHRAQIIGWRIEYHTGDECGCLAWPICFQETESVWCEVEQIGTEWTFNFFGETSFNALEDAHDYAQKRLADSCKSRERKAVAAST